MLKSLPIVAVILFIVACCLPALTFKVYYIGGAPTDPETLAGWSVVLLGWMGMFGGQFGWIANPLLVLGLVVRLLTKRRAPSVTIVVLALAAALSSLMLFHQKLPHDEGGMTEMTLQRLEPGFYFWIASIVVALIAAWVWPARQKVAPAAPGEV